MLPEYRDRLQERLFVQDDVPRFILSADQIDKLNHKMHPHLQDHRPVTVFHYKYKHIQQLRGILHSYDLNTRILVVYDDYEPVQLKLKDILSITS